MESMNIFSNEFIIITSQNNDVYIETLKKGFPMDKIHGILAAHPQIEITSFTSLKSAIGNAPKPPEKIGHLKERIEIQFMDYDLKAIITYNLTREELDIKNRQKLIQETSAKLKEKGVIYGVNSSIFAKDILPGNHYVIAEGLHPVNGKDAIIKMYELKDAKPEINEDGSVDFYELKLINKVKVGDWLGERIEPTLGVPGKSVKGEPVKALDGKTLPLLYDKTTVTETQGNGITVLHSRLNGAVSYIDGKITVSNHLEIEGDVDFKTGNIKFDGYLSIKGTVADGFLVVATKDIEINGELGLGNVKGIISTHGSIFIKGGIASRGKVEIKAAKNIYTKFVDDATVSCGETLHIGFYCINSTIQAKEVVIDSTNGHIIGGSIKAQVKVTAPIIGSDREKRTIIEVTGFDRESFKEQTETIMQKMVDLKNEQQKMKQIVNHLDDLDELNAFQQKEYNNCFERFLSIKEEMRDLEVQRKLLNGYLKAKGQGEICITKKVFPNCLLILKKSQMEISSPMLAASIYLQDGEIKQV